MGFGSYQVVGELGRGGMGVVYLAIDPALQRYVALKVLLPDTAGDPDRKARLLREARAAARIDHPNVVSVFAAGEEGDAVYVAMQYVAGWSLKEVIRRRGRIAWRDALTLGAGVARGLAAAHALGIVHRDVKPQNILVSPPDAAAPDATQRLDVVPGGARVVPWGTVESTDLAAARPRVADFGLARVMDAGSESTRSGTFVGTLAYASPEQVDLQPVDARSDIYSLGVVLYEMLAGDTPYRAESSLALVRQILIDPPPPLQGVAPDIPAGVESLVRACLAKDPADRPAGAAALADEMGRLLAEAGDGRPPRLLPRTSRPRRRASSGASAKSEISRRRSRAPRAPPTDSSR